MGGELKFDSSYTGGAKFIIEIPVIDEEETEEQEHSTDLQTVSSM